jgi:hypothetical protein
MRRQARQGRQQQQRKRPVWPWVLVGMAAIGLWMRL